MSVPWPRYEAGTIPDFSNDWEWQFLGSDDLPPDIDV
jgi:hypothetical protein